MFGFGPVELLIVLAIVLLIFGSKRIGSMGADLGRAIKGFRKAVKTDEADAHPERHSERIIDGEAKRDADARDTDSGKSGKF